MWCLPLTGPQVQIAGAGMAHAACAGLAECILPTVHALYLHSPCTSPTISPSPFSLPSLPVEPIQRSDVNACCLPGGIVFVHSGLIRAVEGRQDSLAFVLGHEVSHSQVGGGSMLQRAAAHCVFCSGMLEDA